MNLKTGQLLLLIKYATETEAGLGTRWCCWCKTCVVLREALGYEDAAGPFLHRAVNRKGGKR